MKSDWQGLQPSGALGDFVNPKPGQVYHKCLDCPAHLSSPNALRCHSCAHTRKLAQSRAAAKRQRGGSAPIDRTPHKCLDCPKMLENPRALRCHRCAYDENVKRQRERTARNIKAKKNERYQRIDTLIKKMDGRKSSMQLTPDLCAEMVGYLKRLRRLENGSDGAID